MCRLVCVDVAFMMLPRILRWNFDLMVPGLCGPPPGITPGHTAACSERGDGTGRKTCENPRFSPPSAAGWAPFPMSTESRISIFGFVAWSLMPSEGWLGRVRVRWTKAWIKDVRTGSLLLATPRSPDFLPQLWEERPSRLQHPGLRSSCRSMSCRNPCSLLRATTSVE